MRKIVAFYAWQSDTARQVNSDFIRIALTEAAQRITKDKSLEVEVSVDSDTEGIPGTPPVTETILKKIAACDIFVPDLTFVARTDGGKFVPNPNVMTEYGYALRAKTHAAMLPVMNTAFGPVEELPFDMGHLRRPIQYHVEASAKDLERRDSRAKLSEDIERALRLQIAATAPPVLPPLAFRQADPKDGPARFRTAGEPIGKRWNDIPMPIAPRQNVTFAKGPAVWLRLMPTFDQGRKWPIDELKRNAMPPGRFYLSPFIVRAGIGNNLFTLGAEDGMGICDLDAPDASETPSVAFAFRTGEVWSIDTTLLTYHPGLLVGEIEKLYTARLEDYALFLGSIGAAKPYSWIAGVTDVKGRRLQAPVLHTQGSIGLVASECLAKDIIAEGTYDGTQPPADALIPFFDAIFDECGARRPERGVASV